MKRRNAQWLVVSLGLLAVIFAGILLAGSGALAAESPAAGMPAGAGDEYVVLAWNDLGMHCYNADFDDIGVLPPWNTLWAQVIRIGDPPELITSGVTVEFYFADNTYSVGKSNFWDASPYQAGQNAQLLFGLSQPLTDDIGLTGTGLSGEMEVHGDHWVAEGIPITEFQDSDPTTAYPYQVATIIVRDEVTGVELARTNPVAPVSTEMHCDNCHYDNGPGNEDFATGVIEQNILSQHDAEHAAEYPPGHEGPLMDRRPILCAECHASNALGAAGAPGVPNLSEAIHDKHKEEVTQDLDGCYNCHPGPETQCLRDVMYTDYQMDCVDCHGPMAQVAANPDPWLNEPRCDNAACHGSAYQQDQALYRMSKEHGGVYCAACHDSPHAIAPSGEANDALKFVALQGHNGPVNDCIVCHDAWPADAGPHGLLAPPTRSFVFEPDYIRSGAPGVQIIYQHTLQNTGNVSDTYGLEWNSSLGWGSVTANVEPPFSLPPGGTAQMTVTVDIPEGRQVLGMVDTTVLTVASTVSPTLVGTVVDRTMVPRARLYLPVVLRNTP